MEEQFDNLQRFFYRQRTTRNTLAQAQKNLEKLLGGREISEALRKFLLHDLDNNLKYLSNLTVLSPDIAVWQCVATNVHRTCTDSAHQICIYCNGQFKMDEWHQPALRYNRGFPDQTIKDVTDISYTQTENSISIEYTVVKKDASVTPFVQKKSFQLASD